MNSAKRKEDEPLPAYVTGIDSLPTEEEVDELYRLYGDGKE